MYLVEYPTSRELAGVERRVHADSSARFIYDLVTSALPMSLATVKAASDVAERAMREEHDALLGGIRPAPRLRLVTPVLPLPCPTAPIGGLGA